MAHPYRSSSKVFIWLTLNETLPKFHWTYRVKGHYRVRGLTELGYYRVRETLCKVCEFGSFIELQECFRVSMVIKLGAYRV